MEFREILISLALAVAAGAIIGAERQQSREVEDETTEPPDFGGIRTFPLIALAGALGALSRPVAGWWLLGGLLLGLAVLLGVSYYWSCKHGHYGMSSEVAALLTFGLGVAAVSPELLPGSQRYLFVASVTALLLMLLALKRPLHAFVARVSPADVYATTKFVILALIILPVLPNRTYGPLDVLNPFKIGLMIVLVAGISFAGYIAARVVGSQRGLLAAGLLGGLVSSTAVTMTFAGRAKAEPKVATLCTVAIVAACSTMFARVVVVVAVVEPSLVGSLGWSLGTMAAVGFAASAILYWRHGSERKQTQEEVKLKNPFALGQAISFGLVYGVVLFVAKAAQTYLGSGGLYASSFLAGLTDVDAITLSVAELHQGGLDTAVAALAITIAAVTNTVVKSGMAVSLGGWKLGKQIVAVMGAALVAGFIALAVVRMSG